MIRTGHDHVGNGSREAMDGLRIAWEPPLARLTRAARYPAAQLRRMCQGLDGDVGALVRQELAEERHTHGS